MRNKRNREGRKGKKNLKMKDSVTFGARKKMTMPPYLKLHHDLTMRNALTPIQQSGTPPPVQAGNSLPDRQYTKKQCVLKISGEKN